MKTLLSCKCSLFLPFAISASFSTSVSGNSYCHRRPMLCIARANIPNPAEINRLAKRMNIRQQALATAQLYIKRFYTKVEIRRTNPYMIIATALYLACKMEECPQHIRLLTNEAKGLWPSDFIGLDTSKVGESEFFMISEMNSQLIVHQPYRTLTSLQAEFSLSSDELGLAWSVVNDHYMTDLPLLYAPHIVALTAILLALVLRPSNVPSATGGGAAGNTGSAGVYQSSLAIATSTLAQAQARAALQGGHSSQGMAQQQNSGSQQSSQGSQGDSTPERRPQDARVGKVTRFAHWLADSNINIEAMVDCAQELISCYECLEQYNDKITQEQIKRYIKARGLDK